VTTTNLQPYRTIHFSTYNQFVPHRERTLFTKLTCLPFYVLSYFRTLLLTYFLTYLIPPLSTVLSEELTVTQQFKKFPTFYVTRRFIPTFTTARHLSLSSTKSIQFVPSYPTSWISILLLSWVFQLVSYLRVSPPKPCIPLSTPHKPSLHRQPHSRFYHPNNIWWAVQIIKQYRSLSSTDH